MTDWGYEGALKDLISKCAADRDLLLGEILKRYPEYDSAKPAELVELVILDCCNFHVVDRPLAHKQLARVNFGLRRVTIQSRMKSFVHQNTNLVALRRSTLAHELGHIRLHNDEIHEQVFDSYYPDQFSNRVYQKEREADLYAAIFLVPKAQLLKSGPMKRFIRARLDGRQLSNSTIWSTIYPLARHFKVSPTLMRRCLVDLGWLKRTPRANSKSHLSLVLRTPAEQ